jgi:hypothetical protein
MFMSATWIASILTPINRECLPSPHPESLAQAMGSYIAGRIQDSARFSVFVEELKLG